MLLEGRSPHSTLTLFPTYIGLCWAWEAPRLREPLVLFLDEESLGFLITWAEHFVPGGEDFCGLQGQPAPRYRLPPTTRCPWLPGGSRTQSRILPTVLALPIIPTGLWPSPIQHTLSRARPPTELLNHPSGVQGHAPGTCSWKGKQTCRCTLMLPVGGRMFK